MEVKCPKCRYRFEVWRPSGARELACVCPRCGTPFSYIVPEDDQEITDAHAEDGFQQTSKPLSADLKTVMSNAQSRYEQSSKPSSANGGDDYGVAEGSGRVEQQRLKPDDSVAAPTRRGGGCGFKIFLLFLALAVAAVITGPRACSHEESFTSEDIEPSAGEASFVEVPSDTLNTSVTAADAKPTPDWVFGRWLVKTEYGLIEVHIADKWISEKSEGGTCHGVFFYTPGQLNCTFKDDGHDVRTFYRLDEDNQRIDAGEGMWMQKVSDS